MKKLRIVLPLCLLIAAVACNNAGKDAASDNDSQQAVADSLLKDITDGHDIAMPKSMKIPKLKAEASRLIDSISRLPEKARAAAAPYKADLEALVQELESAYTSMSKWMSEFRLDSAKNNLEQRISYFTEEKLKVDRMKDKVLSSLKKADSLIKPRP